MPSNPVSSMSSSRLDRVLSDTNFKKSCEAIIERTKNFDTRLLNSILAHDESEKPIIEDNEDIYVWYFAIGSMTNPVSLYLRDITPLLSYPAKCPNHRLVFRAPCGMADIQECEGDEFHGVVHLVPLDQMLHLDHVEHMYTRIIVRIIDYQQRSHLVYAYKMGLIGDHEQPIGLPTERYLDIIIKGCEYFDVCFSYIDNLKSNQPCIPRKSSDTYQTITNIPENVYYTEEDLLEHDGKNPVIPIWISINGKILEYSGLPSADHLDYENQKRFYDFALNNLSGREVAHIISKAWYEPMYKLALNENDLSNEHRAFAEDMCVCWGIHVDEKKKDSHWKPIGRLRQTPSKDLFE